MQSNDIQSFQDNNTHYSSSWKQNKPHWEQAKWSPHTARFVHVLSKMSLEGWKWPRIACNAPIHSLGTLSVCLRSVVHLCTRVGCQWTRMCLSVSLTVQCYYSLCSGELCLCGLPPSAWKVIEWEKVKVTWSNLQQSSDGISCVLIFPRYHDLNIPHLKQCVGGADSGHWGLQQMTWCHCLFPRTGPLVTSEMNGGPWFFFCLQGKTVQQTPRPKENYPFLNFFLTARS